MKREILFRGKRKDNGEWVESGSIRQFDNGEICLSINIIWGEIDPETLGQYTGLKDKNGTKIFEGDIIECGLERFTVEWDDEFAGFYLGDVYPEYQGCATLSDVSKDGVVIGNIYDNPGLLRGDYEQ